MCVLWPEEIGEIDNEKFGSVVEHKRETCAKVHTHVQTHTCTGCTLRGWYVIDHCTSVSLITSNHCCNFTS